MAERPSKKPTVRRSPGTPTQPRSAQRASRDRASKPASARHSSHARKGATPRAYNEPAVWTKGDPKKSSSSAVGRAFGAIGRFLLAVLALLGRGLASLGRALGSLLSRSRVALILVIVVAVVGVGCLVDFGLHAGKAYPGVRVGEVDAAGKTAEEIEALVNETYAGRLVSNSVVVYANDDAAARIADAAASAQDAALAEQLAVEEAQANKLAWTADATTLEATLPAAELAREAVAVGRDDGGLIARIASLFGGHTVEVRVNYSEVALESLASDIDATIGDPRVDYDITLTDGVASVTDGHDGDMVNREGFKRSLDQVFLSPDAVQGSFVAKVEHAPLRIGPDAAQAVADAVNRAIADGARFTYDGSTWNATATDLGAWIATRVEAGSGGHVLRAYIDEGQAKPILLAHVEQLGQSEPVHVTFEANGDDVRVRTDGTGTIPLAAEAVGQLNAVLFGEGEKALGAEGAPPAGSPVEIGIASGSAPAELGFDEAVDLGIVGTIASFTTEFTTGAGTENRNHNIELVSQLLSNSVVKPNERWSFNGTAGECNAEKGFLGAGAIIDGEYDDAVGGGICQVATTVFNAVYDSGFPVKTRHNHSLYISSYPTGRDAAVSWPDLDLVWENDGDSDVLVRLSCADGSVTATLYGVDPGYLVSTSTGEWSEGAKYTTKTKVDETLAPGTSYTKTRGTDGRTITVVRTVTDESGAVLREDAFSSVYDPMTEVVVKGPDVVNDDTGGASAGGASA